jgi:hypothetical protein
MSNDLDVVSGLGGGNWVVVSFSFGVFSLPFDPMQGHGHCSATAIPSRYRLHLRGDGRHHIWCFGQMTKRDLLPVMTTMYKYF